MSCNGELERRCKEHVLSLEPTPGEADEFRELNDRLLAPVFIPRRRIIDKVLTMTIGCFVAPAINKLSPSIYAQL